MGLSWAVAVILLTVAVAWPVGTPRNMFWWGANIVLVAAVCSFLLSARARGLLSVGSPGLLFVVIFGLFHFGSLGDHPRGWYAPALREQAWLLCVCCLCGWMCGYTLGRGRSRVLTPVDVRLCGVPFKRTAARTVMWAGALMFLTGVGLQYLFIRGHGLVDFFAMGYLDARQAMAPTSGNPWSYAFSLGQLACTVGVTLVVTASALTYRRLFPSRLLAAVVVSYGLALLALGDRSEVLVVAFPILLIRHVFVRPFRLVHALAAGVVLAMLFMGASIYRGSKQLDDFASAAVDPHEFGRGLNEAGYTFDTVVRSLELVPEHELYFWGATYVHALARAVPNVTFTHRSWGFVSSEWITRETAPDMLAVGEGMAFSIVAEAYINFGRLGASLILFAIGLAHGRGERALVGRRLEVFGIVVYILLEIALLLHVRNTVVMYLRGGLWMIALSGPVLVLVAVSSWGRQRSRWRTGAPGARTVRSANQCRNKTNGEARAHPLSTLSSSVSTDTSRWRATG